MRKLILAALAVAFVGCNSTERVPQLPTPGRTASYILIAVDNLGLPQAPLSGADQDKEIVAGQLTLNANGSFDFVTTMRTQMSSAKPFTYDRSNKGRYELSPLGIQLVRSSGVIESGAFVGTNLKIFSDGVEYLFRRAN